jgi:arabinan endo-1,5-alpha-L-arabinosidase
MPRHPEISVDVHVDAAGGRTFIFTSAAEAGRALERHTDRILSPTQQEYLDLFERMAHDLGTRMPRNRTLRALPSPATFHRPLLTEAISPAILYGYGDPAMLRRCLVSGGDVQ